MQPSVRSATALKPLQTNLNTTIQCLDDGAFLTWELRDDRSQSFRSLGGDRASATVSQDRVECEAFWMFLFLLAPCARRDSLYIILRSLQVLDLNSGSPAFEHRLKIRCLC